MKDLSLEHLSLYNFKNYESAALDLKAQFICFVGSNGSGKTNLLDAIYYLCTCKSFFNQVDSQNILFDVDQCSITGEFRKDQQPEQVVCSIRKNHRKVFKRNFKEYEKLSEHIGLFPAVIITPYDIELIWEGSEVRRKFLDSTLSQMSKTYLDQLVSYNHALLQRNNLLKAFARKGGYSADLMEPWDYQLIEKGRFIYEERKRFLQEFTSSFNEVYQEISGGVEQTELVYYSDLNEKTLEDLLKENAERDRILERTAAGIHRDDLEFTISGYPLKKFASQGQQKSFLFALKLAQYKFMSAHLGIRPILMLDDLFDKIDERRMTNILNWMSNNDVGQVFITDTHHDRIPQVLASRGLSHEVWEVNGGKVSALK